MKIKFKEIANFVAGQSPQSKYYTDNEGTPFLQGNRTFGQFYPEIDTYTTKVTKMAKKGDILMSVRAPVGDLNFAPIDLCIGRGLSAISAKDGNNDFLFYALRYNIENLKKQGNGTTYDSVNKDIVENMEMIIPDQDDIKIKVAKLLRNIDDKIENNNKINAELEAMAKTIYDYWFLQFEFPNEERKPYKSSGGKMVWNEELKREIPEGWEVEKINNILAKTESTKKYKVDEYKKSGKYPIIDQSINFICGYTNDESELIKLKDCIVFGDHTKYTKYINFDFAKGADGTQIINSKNESLPNYLLYRQILDMGLVSQGYSRYFKFLKDKDVIIPSNAISKIYIKTMKPILNKKKNIIFENQELSSLRDFLLPLLMNGQVGFKEVALDSIL